MKQSEALALASKLFGHYPSMTADDASLSVWSSRFMETSSPVIELAIRKHTDSEKWLDWATFKIYIGMANDVIRAQRVKDNPPIAITDGRERPATPEERKKTLEAIKSLEKKWGAPQNFWRKACGFPELKAGGKNDDNSGKRSTEKRRKKLEDQKNQILDQEKRS